jgi:phage terminase large subunit-like protein
VPVRSRYRYISKEVVDRQLAPKTIEQLNEFAVFLSFKLSTIGKKFLSSPYKITGIFSGNQFGKNGNTAYGYVQRVLGRHPVPEKNPDHFVCSCGMKWNVAKVPKDMVCDRCSGQVEMYCSPVRVIRFASESLPGDTTDVKGAESAEVKNTQYPEFKKWVPSFLIKKDITSRSYKMTVRSAVSGKDIIFEFVSYSQSVQSTAGSQRFSIWCDEEPPKAFYDEQLPRLLAADGDLIITLTPANYISWVHDEIFDRASAYFRSDIISKKFGLKRTEIIRDDLQIGVYQAATDDNPTLRPEVIDRLFDSYDDPAVIEIRRYGQFRQVSGRIFKSFEWNIHMIDEHKYFPAGIPHEGFHARAVDYHGRNPWAVGWFWLSENNELFIYDEMKPSPESNTTDVIVEEMAHKSGTYRYRLNLIDPFVKASQGKTGPLVTVLDDMNHYFGVLKKQGVGTGGYWEVWDRSLNAVGTTLNYD